VSSASPGLPRGLAVLGVGVLAISSAAVLIVGSEAPPLVTAFWRVALSTVAMGAIAAVARMRGQRDAPSVAARRSAIASGLCLGLHFYAWMASLQLTSVATSTLLVTTTPIWVGLTAPWFTREAPLSARGWAGLGVALGGGALLVVAESSGGGADPAGAGLAILGAWCAAAYLMFGKQARQQMSLATYATWANGAAAVLLATLALATDTALLPLSTQTWWMVLGLALVPQLIGHNSLLWAVRYVDASLVSVVVLLEPVGATLLAWLVFGAPPTGVEVLGGAILLVGVTLVVRARARTRAKT